MDRNRLNQTGSTPLIVVLIVVVVVVLFGMAGWIVYRHNNKTMRVDSTNTPSQSTKRQVTSTDKHLARTADQSFTIEEWGVSAPYTGQDSFTYRLSTDKKIATVVSEQLSSKDSGCTSFGAGQIERFSANDYAYAAGTGPTVVENAQQNPTQYTHVGDYYYQFIHDQSECGSTSIIDQNQANDTVKTLVANLQAVSN